MALSRELYCRIIDNKITKNQSYHIEKALELAQINLDNRKDIGVFQHSINDISNNIIQQFTDEIYTKDKEFNLRKRILFDIVYNQKSITKLSDIYCVIYGDRVCNVWTASEWDLFSYSPPSYVYSSILYINKYKYLLPLCLEAGGVGCSLTVLKGKIKVSLIETEDMYDVSMEIRKRIKRNENCPFILNKFQHYLLDNIGFKEKINQITVHSGECLYIAPGMIKQIAVGDDSIWHKNVWYPYAKNNLKQEYMIYNKLYMQYMFFHELLMYSACNKCTKYHLNTSVLLNNKNNLENNVFTDQDNTLMSCAVVMVACINWKDYVIQKMVNESLETDNIYIKGDDIHDALLIWVPSIKEYISIGELVKYDEKITKIRDEKKKKCNKGRKKNYKNKGRKRMMKCRIYHIKILNNLKFKNLMYKKQIKKIHKIQ